MKDKTRKIIILVLVLLLLLTGLGFGVWHFVIKNPNVTGDKKTIIVTNEFEKQMIEDITKGIEDYEILKTSKNYSFMKDFELSEDDRQLIQSADIFVYSKDVDQKLIDTIPDKVMSKLNTIDLLEGYEEVKLLGIENSIDVLANKVSEDPEINADLDIDINDYFEGNPEFAKDPYIRYKLKDLKEGDIGNNLDKDRFPDLDTYIKTTYKTQGGKMVVIEDKETGIEYHFSVTKGIGYSRFEKIVIGDKEYTKANRAELDLEKERSKAGKKEEDETEEKESSDEKEKESESKDDDKKEEVVEEKDEEEKEASLNQYELMFVSNEEKDEEVSMNDKSFNNNLIIPSHVPYNDFNVLEEMIKNFVESMVPYASDKNLEIMQSNAKELISFIESIKEDIFNNLLEIEKPMLVYVGNGVPKSYALWFKNRPGIASLLDNDDQSGRINILKILDFTANYPKTKVLLDSNIDPRIVEELERANEKVEMYFVDFTLTSETGPNFRESLQLMVSRVEKSIMDFK